MAGEMGRIPMHRPILMGLDKEVKYSGEMASLAADTVFEFFEEREGSSESCYNENYVDDDEGDEEGESGHPSNVAESKAFWDAQHQLLQATLGRSSSVESKIRRASKEALRESQMTGNICICQRVPFIGGCRKCLLRDVCDRLQNAGFNSAICKSNWRSTPYTPSGEHTYLDVVDKSNPKKGEVRVVIELSFRAEFEMARASNEYNELINRLPEVFVGKPERLRNLVKIICSASKKCMKENKMHMGPWRKHKYMQAKWFNTYKRIIMPLPHITKGFSDQRAKLKASMLTFDLLENLPTSHCTTIQVV